MRILAVDPGERKIGLAVSDPGGIVARPLTTLDHESRGADAARIVALAAEHGVELILVGLALEASGQTGPAARHAERLAESIRELTLLPVRLYDESLSTQIAHDAMLVSGRTRQDRHALIHAASAAAILQSYLDAHSSE
jgi:putative holliday junction resolvase